MKRSLTLVVSLSAALVMPEAPAQEQHLGPVPPGYVVVEGDMLIPEDVVRAVADGYLGSHTDVVPELWPGGVVPFTFDASMGPNGEQDALQAMADWESEVDVDFRPRQAGDADWVHIVLTGGECSSFVGRQGGQQVLNITTGCLSSFSIHHELAHALGYFHEQSRPDRDTFITIHEDNIEFGEEHNFDVAGEAYGPYDFDSVMHYPAWAFSIGGDTITVNPPWDDEWQDAIGQRDHLSTWDVRVMSFLYPAWGWRFFDTDGSGAEAGTFLQPFHGSLSQAIQDTPASGRLHILDPGTYNLSSITKPITLDAPVGGVTLDS